MAVVERTVVSMKDQEKKSKAAAAPAAEQGEPTARQAHVTVRRPTLDPSG